MPLTGVTFPLEEPLLLELLDELPEPDVVPPDEDDVVPPLDPEGLPLLLEGPVGDPELELLSSELSPPSYDVLGPELLPLPLDPDIGELPLLPALVPLEFPSGDEPGGSDVPDAQADANASPAKLTPIVHLRSPPKRSTMFDLPTTFA